MAEESASASPTPVETTETSVAPHEAGESSLTVEQWRGISRVIDNIYGHREPE